MEEVNLDGVDFSLNSDSENYTLIFNEIFPDDAGVYKVSTEIIQNENCMQNFFS
jgi:hypothetical protein